MLASTNLKNYFLSQLLPYDTSIKKNASLQISLKEYQLLLSIAIKASDMLQNDYLERFDALVGENACEICAVRIALIASQNLVDTNSLSNKIANVQKYTERLLFPTTIDSLMKKNISLKEVMKTEKLDVSLTDDEMFIIQSFLLAETTEQNPMDELVTLLCLQQKVNSKKLKRFGDVSSTLTHSLVSRARKLLSEASVHFVRTAATAFQDPKLISIVSENFTVKHNAR